MAQGERLLYKNVSIAEMVEVMQVRTAQSRGLDSDLDFARRERGQVSLFLRQLGTRYELDCKTGQLTSLSSFAPWRTEV